MARTDERRSSLEEGEERGNILDGLIASSQSVPPAPFSPPPPTLRPRTLHREPRIYCLLMMLGDTILYLSNFQIYEVTVFHLLDKLHTVAPCSIPGLFRRRAKSLPIEFRPPLFPQMSLIVIRKEHTTIHVKVMILSDKSKTFKPAIRLGEVWQCFGLTHAT